MTFDQSASEVTAIKNLKLGHVPMNEYLHIDSKELVKSLINLEYN